MKERADPRLSRGGGSAASRRGYWFLFGVWAASLALGLLFTGLWRERALDSQFSPSSAWQEPMLYGLGGAFGFLREAAGWTLVLRYPLRRCLLPFGIACFLRWGRALAGARGLEADTALWRYLLDSFFLPLLSCAALFLLAKGLSRLLHGREWAAFLGLTASYRLAEWLAAGAWAGFSSSLLLNTARDALVGIAAYGLLSLCLRWWEKAPPAFPSLQHDRKVGLPMTDFIEGGVTAAKGFTAAGIHCGIRKNREKKDLALILSDRPAAAAAVYTRNLVKGAPIAVTAAHLENGVARAVICNSGIANTCAADGVEKANAMCRLTAEALGIAEQDVIVASTGVIGPSIDLAPIEAGLPALAAALSVEGHAAAAEAIMTTDTVKKEFAVRFTLGDVPCAMGGIAKGSGMIAPNMATMLSFITTDAAVSAPLLRQALAEVAADTFNMMSVDGDTSTNDTLAILANGAAGNPPVNTPGEDYAAFVQALRALCTALTKALAADGEGATKLLECRVTGGKTTADAKTVAKAVVNSALLKAAMFGADANWGRVLCAIGYSGAQVDIQGVDVAFSSAAGSIPVCLSGAGIPFSEEKAKAILSEKEIVIAVTLHDGEASATAWGCDLTYDYVKINGDYRS